MFSGLLAEYSQLKLFSCLRFCGGDTLLAAIWVAANYTTNNPLNYTGYAIFPHLKQRRILVFNTHIYPARISLSFNADFSTFIYTLKSFPLPATKTKTTTKSANLVELKSVHNLFNLVLVVWCVFALCMWFIFFNFLLKLIGFFEMLNYLKLNPFSWVSEIVVY